MKPDQLRELADRIDHEQLWARAGMTHRDMTPEQIDRMNAGVELRRWADALAPGRWLVIAPTGPARFSAATLEGAFAMARKHEERTKGLT